MRPLEGDEPTVVGPYRLLGRLGSGGMGRVRQGRGAGGRAVAVRIVHPHFAPDEEFRALPHARLRSRGGTPIGARSTPPAGSAAPGRPPSSTPTPTPGPPGRHRPRGRTVPRRGGHRHRPAARAHRTGARRGTGVRGDGQPPVPRRLLGGPAVQGRARAARTGRTGRRTARARRGVPRQGPVRPPDPHRTGPPPGPRGRRGPPGDGRPAAGSPGGAGEPGRGATPEPGGGGRGAVGAGGVQQAVGGGESEEPASPTT